MIKAEAVGFRSGCFVVWIALKRQNKTMVKDRLSELKSKRKYTSDVNLDLVPSKSQEEIFCNLEKFSELTEWIRTIRANIEEMRSAISTPSFHYNDKVIRDKVERKMDHSLGLCKQIYAAIKRLQEELEEEERRGSVLFRIKHTQFLVIKDDYLNAYREHEEFVNYYENKVVNLMKMEAKASPLGLRREGTELCSGLTDGYFFPFSELQHYGRRSGRNAGQQSDVSVCGEYSGRNGTGAAETSGHYGAALAVDRTGEVPGRDSGSFRADINAGHGAG